MAPKLLIGHGPSGPRISARILLIVLASCQHEKAGDNCNTRAHRVGPNGCLLWSQMLDPSGNDARVLRLQGGLPVASIQHPCDLAMRLLDIDTGQTLRTQIPPSGAKEQPA